MRGEIGVTAGRGGPEERGFEVAASPPAHEQDLLSRAEQRGAAGPEKVAAQLLVGGVPGRRAFRLYVRGSQSPPPRPDPPRPAPPRPAPPRPAPPRPASPRLIILSSPSPHYPLMVPQGARRRLLGRGRARGRRGAASRGPCRHSPSGRSF
jgi:hypothetical protein